MTPASRLLREARARMRTSDVVIRPDGAPEMDPAENPLRRVLEGVKLRVANGAPSQLREAEGMLRAVLA